MVQTKTSELTQKLLNGKAIRLTFHYHTKEISRFINSLLVKVLSSNDMSYLQSVVETIIREMILNAVKANSKRVFFRKIDLNIEDKEHYKTGMEQFKSFIVSEQSKLIRDLKEGGYTVDLIMKKGPNGFDVTIQNNSSLLPFEKERIDYRIQKALSYSDFSDIYMDISDDQEGEGLGIPLTILFLRNSGMGEDSFAIQSKGNITRSAFTIPLNLQSVELKKSIKEQVIDQLDDLPTFPEYIQELQALCHKKNIAISEVASKVSMDPSLSASVLRLANSGGFITSRNIENLNDAIMTVGLKNLNAILVTIGARKILDEHFAEFKGIWRHCNKTAYYARKIAEWYKLNAISDRVYLASLLHDLGKIALLSNDRAIMDIIDSITEKRKIRTSTVIEEISIGISHTTIGKYIAERWKFPDYIIEAIAYHHSPLQASEQNKEVIYITYLANKLCLIEDNKFDFLFFEDRVLEYFNLFEEKVFNSFHEKLIKDYEDHGL